MSADTGAKFGPASAVNSVANEKKQLAKQDLKTRIAVLTKTPQFKTITIVSAGGAVTLSAVGGAFGAATGVVTGSLAGVVPAIFTLGLSIPVGATVGGTVGLVVGATAGGATGAAGGGVVGYGGHRYRNEIGAGVLTIKKSASGGVRSVKIFVHDKHTAAKAQITQGGKKTIEFARVKMCNGIDVIQEKASKLERKHIVIGGAGAGAVAGGATGGGAGVLVGGTVGAAVGVVPALFTFGLSIPVCAVIGGAIGGGVGVTAGGTGGAVVGGAAGHTGHKYRKEIASGASGLKLRASSSAGTFKVKAHERAAQAREHISALFGGTGGTE